jgi:hypothetical protein
MKTVDVVEDPVRGRKKRLSHVSVP